MSGRFLNRFPLVGALGLLLVGMSGCGGYGPKVQHGNIDVHYTEGATQAEADRLGNYLAKAWGDSGGRRTVQLKKTADGYQFRMVIKPEFQKDQQTLKQLQFDGARISRDVFDGAAVELHACDDHLKTLEVFPPRADVRYGVVQGNAEVYYCDKADKADAQRLAEYLAKVLATAPAQASFKLARRGAIVEVHMVFKQDLVNDPAVIAALQKDRNDIAVNVFNGSTVELHLCDPVFDVVKVITP
jgi:hypothetical protein